MKRIFFLVLLCITVVSMKAQYSNQKSKLSFTTTIGTELPVSTPSTTPFTWQLLGYCNLTERWAVGIGTGLSFYEKMLVPVYGDVKFQIGRERKFTPFVELAMGYSFAPSSDANGGYILNPSVGVQYPLTNKMKLQLSIGYTEQEFERRKKHTDNYFHKEFTEKFYYNSISFRIGLQF